MTNGSASTPDRDGVAAPPTLAEVARAAGVSIATASRVLNNSTRVSPEAYQRVCDAASRLGYRRHRAAWGRAQTPVRAVAAVIHAAHRLVFTEPFFARFIGAVEMELAQHDMPLLVTNVSGTLAETVGRYLRAGSVAGVIVVSDHGPLPLSGSLASLGLPVTVVGRPLHPYQVPYVDADNRGGARAAVEYLLGRGRRAIAHLAAPPDTGPGADRRAGYTDAVRAAGLTDLPIAYGDWSQASAAHAMQRLLDQRPQLDAVFAASDVMAAGAVRYLRRVGRRIPDDVAVVGFDDHALATQVRPALTTVRQPIEQIGAVAVRSLLAAAAGELTPEQAATVLPTELILRDSA
ncbi:LacI family DNA-binding transcriptional regulator [Catellatospora bangladeshensis]|uniref:LacI family transcriptional regulator n=1 Tax=Catellatospora bangladeshensis TaxID=310355 RepID=A0A8J3JU23_9ACTN|nr:LacI family DNA-binding transcriptional regulator [Catellatospora bangladeshensis]GIF83169.1 LacI family transcriptional regulator [Catellatospora bangladeshensis]